MCAPQCVVCRAELSGWVLETTGYEFAQVLGLAALRGPGPGLLFAQPFPFIQACGTTIRVLHMCHNVKNVGSHK